MTASVAVATADVIAELVFGVDGRRPLAMHYVWTLQYLDAPVLLLIWIGKVAPTAFTVIRRDRDRERQSGEQAPKSLLLIG